MQEPRDERPDRPATERATHLGEQVGRFASRILLRIESMVRQEMPGQPSTERADGSNPSATEPTGTSSQATERAEELLDGVGTRLALFTALSGPRIRRFVALAREEAEDIWAEAQHIRQSEEKVLENDPDSK
jgi:hypothetical protein